MSRKITNYFDGAETAMTSLWDNMLKVNIAGRDVQLGKGYVLKATENNKPKRKSREAYPTGFDDSITHNLYRMARKQGATVNEVAYSEMCKMFGDTIGYRTGDDRIFLARDYEGKELDSETRRAVFAHELSAGHGHVKTDSETQVDAIALLRNLGDYNAATRAEELGRNAGWLN